MKCDGTCEETRLRLSAKRTSPFKSAGASVHSTTGSRGVRISGSNAGYTMFRGSVKSTGYPLHSPVSPSLLLPCVTVCRHISTGVYSDFSNLVIIPCGFTKCLPFYSHCCTVALLHCPLQNFMSRLQGSQRLQFFSCFSSVRTPTHSTYCN